MYLHSLLRGLERHIVAAGKGDVSESYTVLELRHFARVGEVNCFMHNFEKLLELVVQKEAEEIAQLTGRAA